ncbi:MAG: hypothetical protein JRH20_26995, partial [Deltaproteobacteria bacterium]|nr:hypothetical protein [Deltaproteobacteria bacterium]
EESALLIVGETVGDSEEVLAYGAPEAPRFLGKGLSTAVTGGAPCLGEATGIVKFSPTDHALVREVMDWMLGNPDAPASSLQYKGFGPAKRATEHEELTQRLMLLGHMRAVFSPRLPFMEVDSPAEYAALRQDLYPALLELEAKDAQ